MFKRYVVICIKLSPSNIVCSNFSSRFHPSYPEIVVLYYSKPISHRHVVAAGESIRNGREYPTVLCSCVHNLPPDLFISHGMHLWMVQKKSRYKSLVSMQMSYADTMLLINTVSLFTAPAFHTLPPITKIPNTSALSF